ncbi:hypothetical protein SDRG_05463 [Saprolegnia diclina VS20]|uniref:FYVE-type domain-containing protein n=1 Tax=Saprolegnia diclina (strain VS20) TaxID=1156394 RepID=T0RX99_SAPDV|nr:hypothetical protein SDRG_05463 [Saprolegnia diclina VS20]EQC37238.1 hypothetical protein SDRG_05463 [Saprolegnia diclina VS20]|eukprot:XP_008609400.1 hypothetical protein SDRG_05463 [Saprolegnia diclina VS20]
MGDERYPAPSAPHGLSRLGYELRVAATLRRAAEPLLETDVFAWGYGVEGSLGRDNTQTANLPVRVSALRHASIAQVAAGRHLTLFLDDAGQVYQCGRVGDYVTAANWVPRPVHGLPPMQSVAAGTRACFAIAAPRRVRPLTLGRDDDGEVAVPLDDGGGVVYAWGDGCHGQLGLGCDASMTVPQPVALPTPVVRVCAGHHFTLAITSQGDLYSWGRNSHGQLGHGSTALEPTPRRVEGLPRVRTVAAGTSHVLALCGTTVYSWGRSQHGCLGLGGDDRDVPSPVEVAYFRCMRAEKAAAGSDHSLVVCMLGVRTFLYAFGSNAFGQLGLNLTIPYLDTPQCAQEFEYAASSRRIAQIHAGDRFSVALLTNGEVCTWGDGTHGKTSHGVQRQATCVPWAIDAIASRFAIDVAVGFAHGLCRFRQDAATRMNRFRQFLVPRVISHLLPPERGSLSRACVCTSTLQTSSAPLGLHYHCTTCQKQPLCRHCSLRCHRQHTIELVARDHVGAQCVCEACPAATLPSVPESSVSNAASTRRTLPFG